MAILKFNRYIILEVLVGILVIFLIVSVNNSNKRVAWDFYQSDIFHEYSHGVTVYEGKNPYLRVLEYDLLTNHKYATLFPLYYYFIALFGMVSNFNFEVFMDIFRNILYVAEILGAFVLYLIFRREKQYLVGLLAATFFMFNRWTIANITDAKQDVIAILFLMLFFYFYTSTNKKMKVMSFLFYGISIGFKHIGIFIAPILLLPLIQKELNFKQFFQGILLFLIPTILVGLSLILNNPLAYFLSMLFSFTRESSKLNTEFGYQKLLVLYNLGVENNNIRYYLLPRLPLVVFTLLNTLALWFKKIPPLLYCFTSLFIFIAFNPVLFSQYFTWISPLVFLPLINLLKRTD